MSVKTLRLTQNAKQAKGQSVSCQALHKGSENHKDEAWQDNVDTDIKVISEISTTNFYYHSGTIPTSCLKEDNIVTLPNKGKLLQYDSY